MINEELIMVKDKRKSCLAASTKKARDVIIYFKK
jgi:hypothetical protein